MLRTFGSTSVSSRSRDCERYPTATGPDELLLVDSTMVSPPRQLLQRAQSYPPRGGRSNAANCASITLRSFGSLSALSRSWSLAT